VWQDQKVVGVGMKTLATKYIIIRVNMLLDLTTILFQGIIRIVHEKSNWILHELSNRFLGWEARMLYHLGTMHNLIRRDQTQKGG
jgi:hypothetical protein